MYYGVSSKFLCCITIEIDKGIDEAIRVHFLLQAIHGFRETERQHWYPHNKNIILKVNKLAFDEEIMPYIHVLDLAANGVIKPHVDSSRVPILNIIYICFSSLVNLKTLSCRLCLSCQPYI